MKLWIFRAYRVAEIFLVLVAVVASGTSIPADAQDLQAEQRAKIQLEIDKLRQDIDLGKSKAELEIEKLKKDIDPLHEWVRIALPGALGLIGGAFGGVIGYFLTARRDHKARQERLDESASERAGALNQVTHGKRLELYPELVKATAPLALYFPKYRSKAARVLTPSKCRDMGRDLSAWYFGKGGLLLSSNSRDAYFRFARALTRASEVSPPLDVPRMQDYAAHISKETVDSGRDELGELRPDFKHVELWEFGNPKEIDVKIAGEHPVFSDFVFLQTLSSKLREELTEDIWSRRRPS
jgi:hypothetical protein